MPLAQNEANPLFWKATQAGKLGLPALISRKKKSWRKRKYRVHNLKKHALSYYYMILHVRNIGIR